MAADVLTTGVLIVGAGAAGLRTAIELAMAGVECLVVGKRAHGDAHTRWAAGGINASLGTLDPEDRWELHAADTLREGHFVCDPRAVELLARDSPDLVRELAAWGCPFDRTESGAINQRFFGAQAFRRTCFVGDETGEAMLRVLVQRAEAVGVPWMENVFVTDVLVSGGRAQGALALDMETGSPIVLRAAVTVLACGGYTSIYQRGSSRPDENTGDVAALVLGAGARLRDMEFVQFHPTGWVHPPAMRGRLVTEAVRGEGGHLLNGHGERFMEHYSPERLELDARDVVARAIFREIREGRATEHGGVLLDISHRDASYIAERLPHVCRDFLEHGVDITREPMPVAPTAHYAMGGVDVDFDTGATSIDALHAVGECTGGLHGANRLGGNSLAETVVFGRRTGAHLAASRIPVPGEQASPDVVRHALNRLEVVRARAGSERPREMIEELRTVLWEHAGIIRTGAELSAGLRRLEEIAARLPLAAVGSDASGTEVAAALDLRSMLMAGEAILRAAAVREESRGAHHRADCEQEHDDWRRTILCERAQDGALRVTTRDIAPAPAPILRALAEHRELQYHHLE